MKVKLLARAMIDVFLAHLIVGEDQGFEEADVMFWAWTYFESIRGEQSAERAQGLAREILAYRRTLRRLKNSPAGKPDNVVALILYNISHSGSKDRVKRWRWERRLKTDDCRFHVGTVDEALELIEELRGTYLPERFVGQFLGKTVNLDRVARLVEEEYMALAEEGQHA